MKKIIVIILSVFMIIGVMSTIVSAEGDFPPQWQLGDFGQKSYIINKNTGVVPKLDGVINENEYAFAFEGFSAATNAEDDRFFVVDFPAEGFVADLYLDYDGDYIYVGVRITDPAPLIEGAWNVDDAFSLTFTADKENFMLGDMIKISGKPGAMTAENAYQFKSVIDGNTITYELTIDKYTILDKYAIDELEMIYFRFVASDVTEESVADKAFCNEIWFGFTCKDLQDVYPAYDSGPNRYCYPHVLYFEELETDLPETEAPETEAPAGETEAPAGETEAPAGETNAPETNAPVAGDEKGGCGSSVAAVGVALVAALGTCMVFVSKKR